MTLEQCYEAMHGNYSEAVSRLMNDTLIKKFVLKYPADPTMDQLKAAVDAGDIEASFRAAHTLKGVSANLALTGLANAASDLTEQLRPCAAPADSSLYQAVCQEHQLVIDTLAQFQAEC